MTIAKSRRILRGSGSPSTNVKRTSGNSASEAQRSRSTDLISSSSGSYTEDDSCSGDIVSGVSRRKANVILTLRGQGRPCDSRRQGLGRASPGKQERSYHL